MIEVLECTVTSPLTLSAETAADLMTPNPVSIRDKATVSEAVACLTDKGISAAPVIDKAGRAIGVVSKSDLLIHDRERVESPALSDDSDGTVTRIDTHTGETDGAPIRIAPASTIGFGSAYAIAPAGTAIWATSPSSDTISRIQTKP